jgi:hypothetical protein
MVDYKCLEEDWERGLMGVSEVKKECVLPNHYLVQHCIW